MSADKKINLNCIILGVLCISVVVGFCLFYFGEDKNSGSTNNFDQNESNKRILNEKDESENFNKKKGDNCKNNDSRSPEEKINTEQKSDNLDENNTFDGSYNHDKDQNFSSHYNILKDQKNTESDKRSIDDTQEEEISKESNNSEIKDKSTVNSFTEKNGSLRFEDKICSLRKRFSNKRCKPEDFCPIEIDRNSILADSLSKICLLYTSPSPRDSTSSRMPSSA